MADHAYRMDKQAEVTGTGQDWLSQLREAAELVKEVEEVDDMEVEQGGMEDACNGMGTCGWLV